MVGREVADEHRDAVAQLEREVRGGGAHELADVLEGNLVVGVATVGTLGLAHLVVFVVEVLVVLVFVGAVCVVLVVLVFVGVVLLGVVLVFLGDALCSCAERSTGTIWRRASIRACTACEMALSSPISQP